MQIIGCLLTRALAMPEMQLVMPGPETPRTMPGRPVMYPIAPAA
jgi:hypothetical protein